VSSKYILSILVAERSGAWVCDRSLVGIAGSNLSCGIECCLLFGRGLYLWLFIQSECAVSERDCKASIMGRF
jgi:hypothetical protein